jgi:hypothetical protein
MGHPYSKGRIMERKQKGLVWAALGFTILWVSLVLAVPSPSQAEPPGQNKDVRVINNSGEPVPVTGTVNVGALPAVAVSSLPPVAVSSLPAVQISGPIVVSDPELKREPFRKQIGVLQSGEVSFGNSNVYTVPPGKRLVLESAMFHASLPTGQHGVEAFVGVNDIADAFFAIPLTRQGIVQFRECYSGAVNPGLRVEAGKTLQVFSHWEADVNTGSETSFTLTGYLVDVP